MKKIERDYTSTEHPLNHKSPEPEGINSTGEKFAWRKFNPGFSKEYEKLKRSRVFQNGNMVAGEKAIQKMDGVLLRH